MDSLSIRSFVRPSVCLSESIENAYFRPLVWVGVWRGVWKGGCMPLPTRPRWYFNPTLLFQFSRDFFFWSLQDFSTCLFKRTKNCECVSRIFFSSRKGINTFFAPVNYGICFKNCLSVVFPPPMSQICKMLFFYGTVHSSCNLSIKFLDSLTV